MKVLLESLKDSVIDYPRDTLPLDVWSYNEGIDQYVLREDVEKAIYRAMSKYPEMNIKNVAKEIRIAGSIGTNQYKDNCDIDVHIVPDVEKLPKTKTPAEWTREIFKWYKFNREQAGAFVGAHPIEFYLQLTPSQDLMSDAVYDLINLTWIKGPKIEKATFDPYERYASLIDTISDVVKDADITLGELKRDVIDYGVIKAAVGKLPSEMREKLKTRLKSKLAEIEQDIEVLMKNKKEWLLQRKGSSTPTTPEQALKDIDYIKKWKDVNVVFKFTDRYNYLRLINDLERMLDDEKIDNAEIKQIEDLLGVFKGGS